MRVLFSPKDFTTSLHNRWTERKAQDPKSCSHTESWTLEEWTDELPLLEFVQEEPGYIERRLPEGHVKFTCWNCVTVWEGPLASAPEFVLAADKETK